MLIRKKKLKLEDGILIFNTDFAKIGSVDEISDNLKIRGKYYKLKPSMISNHFIENSNIALYLKVDFSKGIQSPIDVDTLIESTYKRIIVQQSEVKNFYEINFKELFSEVKEHLMEFDIKSGKPTIKHILHFHDNENKINGYFVFYSNDFNNEKYQYLFENTLNDYLNSNCYSKGMSNRCRF